MAPVVLDGGELLCCGPDPRATSSVLGGGDLGRGRSGRRWCFAVPNREDGELTSGGEGGEE